MKVRQFRSVGVLALSYSTVLLLAGRFTGSRAICIPSFRGDGYCDDQNNNADCDYDDGDCCETTCMNAEFMCESDPYWHLKCLDPHELDPKWFSSVDYGESDGDYDYRGCQDDLDGNGNCDRINNSLKCGYDGGDCCEETCVHREYTCGRNGGFDCQDPDYMDEDDDPQQSSPYTHGFWCEEERIGNGYCNPGNNNELCGYDGGDCCSCTCPNAPRIKCGGQAGYTCVDPTAPCLDSYVEAGTLTTVTVKATRYERFEDYSTHYRPECASDVCTPDLTRDGEAVDEASRWACFHGEFACAIVFYFEEPLDIEYVQVAFYRPDIFHRVVEVSTNGMYLGFYESSLESTFTAFGIHADAVETLTLSSKGGRSKYEGFSLLEVRFMVEDSDMYWYAGGSD